MATPSTTISKQLDRALVAIKAEQAAWMAKPKQKRSEAESFQAKLRTIKEIGLYLEQSQTHLHLDHA